MVVQIYVFLLLLIVIFVNVDQVVLFIYNRGSCGCPDHVSRA